MQVGPYRIEGELGRGGMGVVYRAHDPGLDRPVALKVLSIAGAGPEDVLRFRREALAMARLRHPGIVGVHAVGQTPQGLPYLVMDLVEGESLAARLARDGPLAPAEAARWFEGAARALAHAHARGVLHRDLKPHNLLVDRDGLVLTDFGLAAVLTAETRLTRSGDAMGTPAYMAPEQATGDRARLGPATDTYGLAATLYHALTGQPPFRGASAVEVLDLVATRAPAPPSSLRPGLAPAVDALLRRGLAKDPAARFPTADALADALAALTASGRAPARGRARAALPAALAVGAAFAGGLGLGRAGTPAASPAPPPVAPADPDAPADPAAPAGPADRLADARRVATFVAVADARRRDDGRAALALLDGLVARDPRDLAARLARAEVRVDRRDGAAREDLEQALALAPRASRALALRALARLDARDAAGARADADAAVAADPDDPGARMARSEVLAAAGDAAAAQADADAARRLDPTSPGPHVLAGRAARAQGRLDQALEAFREGVEAAPWTATARAELANTLLGAGRLDEADAQAQALRALAPQDPTGHLVAATIATLRRRPAEALAAAQAALELQPDDDLARELLARARLLQGSPSPEVLAALGRATEAAARRGHAEPLGWLAQGHLAAGDPFAAARASERALALDPEEPRALTVAAELLPAEQAARARALVDRAIRRAGDLLPEALRCRARLRAKAGDLAGAREDLDRALAAHPEDPVALQLRAALRRLAGDPEGALLDAAAALAPGRAGALDADTSRRLLRTAAADLLQGDLERLVLAAEHGTAREVADAEDLLAPLGDEHALARLVRARARLAVDDRTALDEADAAARLAPRSALAHLTRAAALGRLGRATEALAAADQALALAPDLPVARALAAGAAANVLDFQAVGRHVREGLALRAGERLTGEALRVLEAGLLLGDGKAAEARRSAERGLARQRSVQGAAILAMALARSGEPEAAKRVIAEAWRSLPLAASVVLAEADVFLAEGRPAEALTLLERALRIDPTCLDAMYKLVALVRGREPARALAAVEAVLARHPAPAARLLRAQLRTEAGDLAGARADHEAIREATPVGSPLRLEAERALAALAAPPPRSP